VRPRAPTHEHRPRPPGPRRWGSYSVPFASAMADLRFLALGPSPAGGHCAGIKNRGTSVVQRCVYLQVRPVPKRLKKPPKAALQTSCKHPVTTLPEMGTTVSTCGRHSRLAEILLPPLGVSDGLVGEVGDVAIDGLGVDKAQGFLVAGLAEEALAGPEHDREDLQPKLVDEVVLHER